MVINNPIVTDSEWLQATAVAIQNKDGGGKMEVPDFASRIEQNLQSKAVLDSLINRSITSIENSEVTSIGASAFRDCSNLTSVSFPNVTSIGNSAFSDCTGLTNITFPDSLTTINQDAFSGCTGLTNITFPDSLTTIDRGAFSGCTGLTNITFPDSLTTINQSAFGNCTSLTEIDLKNVTTFLQNAHFQNCRSLRKVIGKKVTSTANSFYFCTSLQTAILPNVSTIGQNTFLMATALENVDCRNVDKIFQGAFSRCAQLSLIDLTSRATPTILDTTDAFYSTNNTWIAVVANDTIKSDFQNATNWSTFASHFKTIAEVEAEVGMTYDAYYYQLFGHARNEVAA